MRTGLILMAKLNDISLHKISVQLENVLLLSCLYPVYVCTCSVVCFLSTVSAHAQWFVSCPQCLHMLSGLFPVHSVCTCSVATLRL